jgi:hypothetical protein
LRVSASAERRREGLGAVFLLVLAIINGVLTITVLQKIIIHIFHLPLPVRLLFFMTIELPNPSFRCCLHYKNCTSPNCNAPSKLQPPSPPRRTSLHKCICTVRLLLLWLPLASRLSYAAAGGCLLGGL